MSTLLSRMAASIGATLMVLALVAGGANLARAEEAAERPDEGAGGGPSTAV